MTFRIHVEHVSTYVYADVVHSSFNEARITPLTTPWQLTLDSKVAVQPNTVVQRYVDYWGSVVHAFDLQHPHRELNVVARSVVETSVPPPAEAELDWDQLADEQLRDDFAEYLAPTTQVPLDPRLAEPAVAARHDHTPAEAAVVAADWVRDQLAYTAGTTGVHTSAIEAWEGGRGVCQDFAHLTLAVLRSMGVPSRYCSGYLHPDTDPPVGPAREGQSHAWVEAWTGDWQGLDPTHGIPTGERHVLVARGRDYSDVTPIKGIFHGGPTSHLDVSVRLTRLA
jgi:transglutaminase-like putative cysteine protease